MTSVSPQPTRKYDLSFARWVYENVDGGDRMALCMQCGTCSGSCPMRTEMDHGPRKLFMMIRAGMKEEVLTSNTIWNCVSCFNCVVRCPRKVPVTYILHDLATVAVREGYAPAKDEAANRFSRAFIWSTKMFGRTDERLVSLGYFFSYGFGAGLKKILAFQGITLGFLKAKRLHFGLPHSIKNKSELKSILAKAAEIEARGHGSSSGEK
ncbi:MAG: 4Fe-4S dicluster domain-containing protein [Alphaproteobacteria bacterium]|nr:4Fe-4S dicluster domain-containing protein [Alphaproteobacteria bacterium]